MLSVHDTVNFVPAEEGGVTGYRPLECRNSGPVFERVAEVVAVQSACQKATDERITCANRSSRLRLERRSVDERVAVVPGKKSQGPNIELRPRTCPSLYRTSV